METSVRRAVVMIQPNPHNAGGGCGARMRPATVAAAVWGALTAAMAVVAALAYRLGGAPALGAIAQEGPISDIALTFYAAAAAWLVLGGFVVLLALGRIDSGNALTAACFLAVSLLYVGFIRERVRYGDVGDYVNAARSLVKGEHLPARYLYPPLWATLLRGLVRHGTRAVFDVLWILNLLSLFALFFLLRATMRRYGFSDRLASLATAGFLLVNVPVARTLGYVQVNFHTLNLMLAALLLYRRSAALSALALALAAHLKVSPLALVAAFVMARDYRWLAWFAISAAAIAGWTVAENGVYPYRDFIANAAGVWSRDYPSYRQFSVDSLVQAVVALFDRGHALMPFVVFPLKAVVAAAGIAAALAHRARRAFADAAGAEGTVLNAAPALFVLMVLLQPIAWPHHCVFLAVPFLALAKRLETEGEWILFGAAYFLVFLMPVHDFFPWSYGRLAALLLWLPFSTSLSRRRAEGRLFARANAWTARGAFKPGPAGEP